MRAAEAEKVREDSRRQRTLIGLVLASILGCPLGGYAFLTVGLLMEGVHLRDFGHWLGMISGLALPIGLFGVVVSFVCGFLLYHLLKGLEITHLLAYLVAGVLGGTVAVQVLTMLTIGASYLGYGTSLFGAMCGGFSALIFWLIRRPDKDARLNHAGSNSTSA